jgi:hypothetical protein
MKTVCLELSSQFKAINGKPSGEIDVYCVRLIQQLEYFWEVNVMPAAKYIRSVGLGIKRCFGLALAFMSAMFTLAAYGQTDEPPAAKISFVGVVKHTTVSAPGTALGIQESMTLEPAKTIAARLGLHFAVVYNISGLPRDEESVIRIVVAHPTMMAPDGKKTDGYSTEARVRSKSDGTAGHMWGYVFDLPHELVAGDWKIELWYGSRRLLGHTIVVTAGEPVADACETINLPVGYPRDFPFLKGGFRLENPAVGGAFAYPIRDRNLVAQFVGCVEQAGWSTKVESHNEPRAPQTRYRFLATRGDRRVSGSIFAFGNISGLLVILEGAVAPDR